MSSYAAHFKMADEVYLLSHSVGLPLRTARESACEQFFAPWENDPESVWPQWLSAVAAFRQSLAALFDDSAENFCPQVNVSGATTKILHSLPELRERPTVLLSEDVFPSLAFVLQKAAGCTVKYLPRDSRVQDPESWKAHLSADVGLLLITHVHSNTGEQLPVKDIVAIAQQQGALTIVDTAQSNGVIPIRLKDWNADFVVGSCVKWLCGGPGAGFLWANPSIVDRAIPSDVGWFSHQDPFEFDIHRFRYAEDALRFWGGTPSVLPFVVASHAIETLTAIGIEAVRAHNLRLTEQLLDGIDAGIIVSPRDSDRRGGTVVLDPGERRQRIEDALHKARVRFDARSQGLRLSPHIYNSADDIARTVDCFNGRAVAW